MDKEKASLERNDKDEVVISLNDIPGYYDDDEEEAESEKFSEKVENSVQPHRIKLIEDSFENGYFARRHNLSLEQLEILRTDYEMYSSSKHYPTFEKLQELAKITKLDMLLILRWMSNERYKLEETCQMTWQNFDDTGKY
ncbi:uncharacterized protein LOC110850104 [Folsomia candida]|uniref:Homeobox protein caupolican n=1 Tax=Folsomia candida TaxID=158441 RepID=A0A226EBQ6_FOLCA|nr:uncharacterized protein LOC110850104 [Folsomia candida]OXA55005.1 Homeobox protein caupolican [Folsomia candida]